MDENEKKEPETAQETPKPEDYSRYIKVVWGQGYKLEGGKP